MDLHPEAGEHVEPVILGNSVRGDRPVSVEDMPAAAKPEVAGVDSRLVLDHELQLTHRRRAFDGVDSDRSLRFASDASLW